MYAMAQKLEIGGLRGLAFRKLRVLGPYPQRVVLEVVGMVDFLPGSSSSSSCHFPSIASQEKAKGKAEKAKEEKGGDGMRGFVVNYLKDNFLELMRQETDKLVEVLETNWDGLARQVFWELGREHAETLKIAAAKKHRDADGVTDSVSTIMANGVQEGEEVGRIQERLEAGFPGFRVYEEV